MTEPIQEARSGSTDLLGTLDEEISFRINGAAKFDAMKKARARGFQSHSEYVRMLVYKDLYGAEHLRRLVLSRLDGDDANVGSVSDIPGAPA